ncbi:hypothetical protein Y695_03675 [Hydrogenophaga sp. T4]|nr:hypothetical protein Y695_03675 [Hydrogenophaga sp. T4]
MIDSASRFFGSAFVTIDRMSRRTESATSATARSNAASFAFDGTLKPLSLRTNCSEASRISNSLAGGSKLNSVLMLRHMGRSCVEGWRHGTKPAAGFQAGGKR